MVSAATTWAPYEPSDSAPWNLRRVVHLHRRAGFAGTWSELNRDLAEGPNAAIDRFLAGGAYTSGSSAEFVTISRALADAAVSSNNPQRLKAWWLYRMIFSPDPLTERLALMWHNHFATSNGKVDNVEFMRVQNETFRDVVQGPFAEILSRVVKGPAMLVWLDADKNRAGHANENLGRELLELFTLGIGHYSERDVQETARSLTGWKVTGTGLVYDERRHDNGEKSILGQTGRFDGDDLLKLLTTQPATADRIAWRICHTLLGDQGADPDAIATLAAGLRERNLNVNWAVAIVLRSARFFDNSNLGSRITGPAEFAVGAVRALECFTRPPSTLLLAEWMALMGQDLFYPPNVGGWPSGRGWLGSGAVLARTQFAAALVDGRLTHDGTPPDLAALVEHHSGSADLHGGIHWFGELLFGGLSPDVVETVERESLRQGANRRSPLATALVCLLSRPEAYLS